MIKISIGQALLILIDNYQKKLISKKRQFILWDVDEKVNEKTNDSLSQQISSLESKLTALKQLYLSGVENEADQYSLNFFLSEGIKNQILAQYEISTEEETISEDPSRRYFETQLAYATLQYTLNDLLSDDLNKHYRLLHDELFPSSSLRDLIDQVLEDEKYVSEFHDEYMRSSHAEYVAKVKKKLSMNEYSLASALIAENILEYKDAMRIVKSKNTYGILNDEQRQKLALLVKCALLSIPILNCFLYLKNEPINQIYKSDPHFNPAYRGRVDKCPETRLSSSHLGLMKRNMPVPQYAIARRDVSSIYSRPADRNTFDAKADGPREAFAKRVHPFSCGLAGQTLVQVEILSYFAAHNKLQFNNPDKLRTFFKCYFSMMLYNSGGHSLYEFTRPFSLKSVQDLFPLIADLNLETLFLDRNEKAFSEALQSTLIYNATVLSKAKMHQQIHSIKKRL